MTTAKDSLSERFEFAVNFVRRIERCPYVPSNQEKLGFYALFKQATEGPCRVPAPSFYQVLARSKWMSWHNCGEMSRDEAMAQYIQLLINTASKFPDLPHKQQLMHILRGQARSSEGAFILDPSPAASDTNDQMAQQAGAIVVKAAAGANGPRLPAGSLSSSLPPASASRKTLHDGLAMSSDDDEVGTECVRPVAGDLPELDESRCDHGYGCSGDDTDQLPPSRRQVDDELAALHGSVQQLEQRMRLLQEKRTLMEEMLYRKYEEMNQRTNYIMNHLREMRSLIYRLFYSRVVLSTLLPLVVVVVGHMLVKRLTTKPAVQQKVVKRAKRWWWLP
eukprot:TRINITY_DN6359_c0_g2_i2.p1 TRINITY_DN6359_c0_g2~~TRINITY_DN6359_c0_g2_i2.p1  ORF type:complete len:334 (-),score=70.21 TRINITY_DN6359_c0_g2_i2:1195-2196(-)